MSDSAAPYWDNGIVQLYQADAREIPLPDQRLTVGVQLGARFDS